MFIKFAKVIRRITITMCAVLFTLNSSIAMAGFPNCQGIKDTHCAAAIAADQYQCTTYVQQNAGWNVGTLGTSLNEKNRRINCYKPKVGAPGSVVVMSFGSYGHVGLVRKVNNNTINISDRNFCCDGQDRQYDISSNDSRISGFIVSSDKYCLSLESSQANPISTPVPVLTRCPSGNGLYCGDSGKGQNSSYLYQCINGSYSVQTACNNGCQKNSAGKNDDECK